MILLVHHTIHTDRRATNLVLTQRRYVTLTTLQRETYTANPNTNNNHATQKLTCIHTSTHMLTSPYIHYLPHWHTTCFTYAITSHTLHCVTHQQPPSTSAPTRPTTTAICVFAPYVQRHPSILPNSPLRTHRARIHERDINNTPTPPPSSSHKHTQDVCSFLTDKDTTCTHQQ